MRLRDEQREWLALTLIPGVGSVHFIRLLARFHTPTNVFKASRVELEELVGKNLAQRIAQYSEVSDVDAQERLMAKCGASLVTLEDTAFPTRLAEIYDPPLVLFVRGELRPEDENCVAIVGTRRPTPYGLRMAEKFGRELAARGITVVSGMASGIDSAAHRGAISAGGRTIAVLGCGVDIVYPPENAELMEQITQHGCVLSQFEMGKKPQAGHFPYRNRIISGISLGTLIVEAPMNSGALITARQAAEQGREVFAIPGQVGVHNSLGPHALIREGAKLTETVEDILVELNVDLSVVNAVPIRPAVSPVPVAQEAAVEAPIPQAAVAKPAAPVQTAPTAHDDKATPVEKKVLSMLSPNGSFVDEIATACRISISEALSSLTILELKGLVRQFSGKRFAPR